MATRNKVCRACLCTEESFTYFLSENVSLEIYLFCTSIQIYEDEKLPKALCDGCYELLNRYSEFKRTCIQSQKTLLACDKTIKTETGLRNSTDMNIRLDYEASMLRDKNLAINDTVKIEDLSDNCNEDLLTAVEFSDVTENKVQMCKRKKFKRLKLLKQPEKCNVKSKISRKPFLFRCDLCNRKFRHQERFEAHKLEHEGKSMALHCLPCKKTFMTWSGLTRHKESEHTVVSVESVSCRTCGRVCKSRHSLRAHEKAHGQRSTCVCHMCGKRVSSAIILKAHLETHKANRERDHTCEHCGKKFFTNTILLSHISRQHTNRRYICDVCSYPFTDKYNLAKHLLIHDGKKLYKCNTCEKTFATNSSLVEHKRIHSGERPFACNYCVKSFLSKRRLADHHRIHTGEKPHKCGVCEQKFTQRGTLRRHMKVHEKVMPAVNENVRILGL